MTDHTSKKDQLAKYALDLQKIYRSEKTKRSELESAHKQLNKYADDLRKTVSKLEEANKRLKKQVVLEEQEKLIERKLIHANKMSSLGTMAKGIAHEINNPICFLLGNTQILMDIWKDAEKILIDLKERKKEIRLGGLDLNDILIHVPKMLSGNFEGTNRISSIISGLKDYSDISTQADFKSVEINKAILFSLTLLERKIKKSKTKLLTNLEDNLPDPDGNSQQIEQVIINLLQNSLNAMDAGSGKIQLRSSYDEKSKAVKILIKDNGIGIEKKDLKKVTEPFFTTSRAHGGTGLGLYISYSIIKEHNGTLEIVSKPGIGTEVTILLPAIKEKKENGRK